MKYPLRIKMAMTLFIIILGAIIGNWFINMVFQEKYYILSKERDLVDVYGLLNGNIKEEESLSVQARRELLSVCENKSITSIVVDPGLELKFYAGYSDSLIERLKSILFDESHDTGDVIRTTEAYTIRNVYDTDSSQNYLEMYGNLESGDLFVIRTSMDSIREVLRVSNQLIAYVGGVVIAISLLAVIVFSLGLTARIEKLASISNEMSKLNFNIKYSDGGRDEISMLGNNMNMLSEKLESTISELKTANNELQKDIQRKEETDRMRKEFLSNVSHELKTPLAIIQGYAEGLKESINEDAESRNFYCDVITDEAMKMNTMVKKLLTLNQIEFGSAMVEMERFDLVTVIDQVLNRHSVLLEEKKAKVIFNNKEKLYVWADEFQVEEVITNYMSNALNHLEKDNIIRVTLREKDGLVRCTVFNSGKHIPEEDIDKIWDKFYKADKARTREYGGSGIGLSIVRAIMQSMNRECGVENEDGGVSFWFEVEKST